VLNRATVLAVQNFYPFAAVGGEGIVAFEAATLVRPPLQTFIGGRWEF
jgi:hypothetical protein